jgi:hypothetical protein
MTFEIGNGELVQVDAPNIVALGRVRAVDGDRVHVALEQGGFLPWIEDAVQLRRFGDGTDRAWDMRIVHCGTATATLEVIGRSQPAPGAAPRIPEPNDTEPDVEPPRR